MPDFEHCVWLNYVDFEQLSRLWTLYLFQQCRFWTSCPFDPCRLWKPCLFDLLNFKQHFLTILTCVFQFHDLTCVNSMKQYRFIVIWLISYSDQNDQKRHSSEGNYLNQILFHDKNGLKNEVLFLKWKTDYHIKWHDNFSYFLLSRKKGLQGCFIEFVWHDNFCLIFFSMKPCSRECLK